MIKNVNVNVNELEMKNCIINEKQAIDMVSIKKTYLCVVFYGEVLYVNVK